MVLVVWIVSTEVPIEPQSLPRKPLLQGHWPVSPLHLPDLSSVFFSSHLHSEIMNLKLDCYFFHFDPLAYLYSLDNHSIWHHTYCTFSQVCNQACNDCTSCQKTPLYNHTVHSHHNLLCFPWCLHHCNYSLRKRHFENKSLFT